MHFCLLSGTSSNSIISSASLSILSSRAHPPCYYLLAVRFIKHSHTHLITYIFTYSNRTLYRSHSTKTGHFSHHKTNEPDTEAHRPSRSNLFVFCHYVTVHTRPVLCFLLHQPHLKASSCSLPKQHVGCCPPPPALLHLALH